VTARSGRTLHTRSALQQPQVGQSDVTDACACAEESDKNGQVLAVRQSNQWTPTRPGAFAPVLLRGQLSRA
jgi:hypothetical protein